MNPSMTENPWAALERQVFGDAAASGGGDGPAPQQPTGGDEGRLSVEGLVDRPWH